MAKTCPSCGYRETDNQALYCNKCGYPFPQEHPRRAAASPVAASRPATVAARRPSRKKSGTSGFLSFETLITTRYLKLIYIIGAVLIILVSIMGIAGMFAKPVKTTAAAAANVSFFNTTTLAQDPAGSPLFWIGFIIIGSVFWRMFCELFVMLSRAGGVTEFGGEPEDETAEYDEGEPAGERDEMTAQMVECPKCRNIVMVEELRECEHCGVQGCSNCIRMMGLLKKTMTCRECFEAK